MSRGGRGFQRGGRGGSRGGYPHRDDGPPATVLEMGSFVHAVEGEMLCTSVMTDWVPYFNAPIYLQNKSVIGKVDEILGPINEVYFSVKMDEGMIASSFKKGDKVYIAGDRLLSMDRFSQKPKVVGGVAKRARGGRGGRPGRGFQRGGPPRGRAVPWRGGGDRGGRGMMRGGSRGRGFGGGGRGGGRGGFRGS